MYKKKDLTTTYVLAVVLIVLFLWRYILNSSSENEESISDDKISEQNVLTEEQNKKIEPDLYTWVHSGSRGTTVKKVQKRLNLIYSKLRYYPIDNMSQNQLDWFERMAIHDKLKVDGIFGKKTEDFVNAVMGRKGTNLFLLRNKYLDIVNIIKNA